MNLIKYLEKFVYFLYTFLLSKHGLITIKKMGSVYGSGKLFHSFITYAVCNICVSYHIS